MDEKRLRIVNKAADGITIDFKGDIGKKKASWEEFNKIYDICQDDKRYCVIKPEWKEKMKKAEELISSALVHYLQVDWKIADPNEVPDIVQMGTVGLYVTEISELLECSYLEAMSLLNYRAIQIRSEFGGGGFKGLGADKIQKPENKKPISEEIKNKEGNTVAEFSPELAKLREQLKKEEGN